MLFLFTNLRVANTHKLALLCRVFAYKYTYQVPGSIHDGNDDVSERGHGQSYANDHAMSSMTWLLLSETSLVALLESTVGGCGESGSVPLLDACCWEVVRASVDLEITRWAALGVGMGTFHLWIDTILDTWESIRYPFRYLFRYFHFLGSIFHITLTAISAISYANLTQLTKTTRIWFDHFICELFQLSGI